MHKRFGIMLSAVLLGFAAVAGQQPATPSPGLLDGRTFVGLNGEKGRELDPNEHEEIVFDNGRFVSTTCYQYGFGDASYSARRIGDTIHFEAVTLSPSHGRIDWQGSVRGERATMTFTWTRERWYWDIRREYWFEGRLKP